jgi:hypothetical protein
MPTCWGHLFLKLDQPGPTVEEVGRYGLWGRGKGGQEDGGGGETLIANWKSFEGPGRRREGERGVADC